MQSELYRGRAGQWTPDYFSRAPMLAASATKRSPSFFPLTHGREVMCRESSLGMVFNEVVYGCVNSSVFAVFFVSLIFRILPSGNGNCATACHIVLNFAILC